jgi:chromosome partitioning protein
MSPLRILAVAAGRGGTGKSTIAYALADALRSSGTASDVALVDLDPQAGLTGYAKRAPTEDPVRDPPVTVHGIELFRGGRALAHANDDEIADHLSRALGTGADRVLVVDMAPALTDVAHRVVFSRDDVMLIGAIKTEPGSFQSLNELVAYVSRRGVPYVLVPAIHRSVLLNNTTLLAMQKQHEGHFSDVVIPLDGKAAECVMAGKPVTMFARRSRAAQAIVQLVEEIFGPRPVPAPASAVSEPLMDHEAVEAPRPTDPEIGPELRG